MAFCLFCCLCLSFSSFSWTGKLNENKTKTTILSKQKVIIKNILFFWLWGNPPNKVQSCGICWRLLIASSRRRGGWCVTGILGPSNTSSACMTTFLLHRCIYNYQNTWSTNDHYFCSFDHQFKQQINIWNQLLPFYPIPNKWWHLRRSPASSVSPPDHTSQSQASQSPYQEDDDDDDLDDHGNRTEKSPPTTRWPSPSGRPRPSRPARGAWSWCSGRSFSPPQAAPLSWSSPSSHPARCPCPA